MNAFVFAYEIGLNGEKQCLETIKTKMKQVERNIYILFNSRYRKMYSDRGHGYILSNGLKYNVLTFVD